MSAHVLLNLLNSWGKVMKYEAEFNKFNSTGAQMLDSISHMTSELLKITFLA